MGMALFESSGTFKPSDYGLSPGDMIHITAVGGGGGGAGGFGGTDGTAGSASSFGNYVTAAGGNPGRYSTSIVDTAPLAQAGANSGLPAMFGPPGYYATDGISATGANSLIAGFGANGWLPNGTPPQLNGFDIVREILGAIISIGRTSGTVSSVFPFFGIIVPYYARYNHSNAAASISGLHETAARTDRRGGAGGGVYVQSMDAGILVSGAGGIGYGAGGGGSASVSSDATGANYGGGGNSGCIVHKDIVITSIDAVAVTVGDGGAGSSSSYNYTGGGGARGCVAVFW